MKNCVSSLTPQLRLLGSTAIVICPLAISPAIADRFYFNGEGGGSWSDSANWTDSRGPVSAADTELSFVTTSAITTINDLGNLSLNRLIFFNMGPLVTVTLAQSGNSSLNFFGSSILNAWSGPLTANIPITVNDSLSMQGPITFNQAISGAGNLAFSSGTYVLASANSFSGGAVIHQNAGVTITSDANLGQADGSLTMYGGTLTFGGPVTLGSARTITLQRFPGGPTSTFSSDSAVTIASTLTGREGFVKSGTGTLTLTGTNNYTGRTSIEAGSLEIGGGGISGSIVGNVTNNASLAFNRSDSFAYDGAISGSGTVTKQGAGTLTLTGTNDYAGLTTISAGALQIGNGGPSGSISGNILNNGALIFNRSDDITYAGVVSGSGTLTKASVGALILTGTNDYSGGTTISGGILQVGNGGSTGAITGSIVNNGTLIFNRSDDVAYGVGDISGTGGVIKDGAGTLSFRGLLATSLSGLTLKSGVFEVGGSFLVNTIGFNGGTLRFRDMGGYSSVNFNTGASVTVSGLGGRVEAEGWDVSADWQISGPGDLHIAAGSHALWLGRSDTRTGATVVESGTFGAMSINGLSAASSYDIRSGATLALTNGSGGNLDQRIGSLKGAGRVDLRTARLTTGADDRDTTFSGRIVGTGELAKTGSGTFTLTGDNTYTGLTTISGGTLQIGDGGSSGAVSGPVLNNAALVFNRSDNVVLGQVISGTGTLTKSGAGLLTLTGTSPLSGATTVASGQLAVNGSLAASSVHVQSGATLSGDGTIGALTAASGAILAPGNSIGTLHVAGPVTIASGSTYQVEINAAGESDRIVATGPTALVGGLVRILPDQGTGYVADRPYTILTASAVSGAFAGTSGGEFAFVTPTLGYSGGAATLTLVRKLDPLPPPPVPVPPAPLAFHTVALTPNQYRTADGVERLGEGHRLYDAVLGSSLAGAREAFDTLSGEVHASATQTAYQHARLVRDVLLNRARQPLGAGARALAHGTVDAADAADLPGTPHRPVAIEIRDQRRFALWGEGFGSASQIRSNGNAASLDSSTGGFLTGAETQLDPASRIGLASGFSRTSFDVDARLSSGTNESTFAALYGSTRRGALSLRLGTSYAFHDVDTRRTVTFPGFADLTMASYHGSSLQAFGEVGYAIAWGRATLEPFVGASVQRLDTDGFQETGGAAALSGRDSDKTLATTTLGIRAQMKVSAEIPLTLTGLLGWRYAYGDVDPEALLAFNGGTAAFTVSGAPLDRSALVVDAGLDWEATRDLSLGLAYAGEIGQDAQSHSLKGNLVWQF